MELAQINGIRKAIIQDLAASSPEESALGGEAGGRVNHSPLFGWDSLSEFPPGTYLQGQILAREGEWVTLLLPEGQELWARLDRGMNVEPGDILSFLVKSREEGILLQPLQTNTASDSVVLKALGEAGFPADHKNILLVSRMMEGGLPVDREALEQMQKQVRRFPDVCVEHIVDLHRMGLAVTDENLFQIDSYKQMTHQIGEGMERVIQDYTLMLEHMVSEGDGGNAARLLEAAVSILPEERGVDIPELDEKGAVDSGRLADSNRQADSYRLAGRGRYVDVNQMGELDKDLLGLLRESWREKLLLMPGDIREASRLGRFYRELDRALGQLSTLVEEGAANREHQVSKSIQTLRSNIHFLEQVNQMYAYVQLPFLSGGKVTHGELYVYTNGKKGALAAEGVSALLHLNMEHLGTTDVHLALQDNCLTTNFYLDKEEYLGLVESQLSLLSGGLEARGYKCRFHVQKADADTKGPLEQLLGVGRGKQTLAKYRFDVRT